MKRKSFMKIAVVTGFVLMLLTWQTGRFSALSVKAKKLELSQEEWIEENRKLESNIAVLSSRSRAANIAPRIGLEKAKPEQKIRVIVAPPRGNDG